MIHNYSTYYQGNKIKKSLQPKLQRWTVRYRQIIWQGVWMPQAVCTTS